jgi:two-component sensor histidine kinase
LLSQKNEQINKDLGENKLLLKEMHHRVKNNFLTVSSLLELQSKDIEDIKAKELAEEGQNRVKSMALIHEKLY